MKKLNLSTIVILGTLTACAASASGQQCTTTMNASGSAVWQYGGNWDQGLPGPGDTACIQAYKFAIISELYCAGGDNAGQDCDGDGDCPGSTCVDVDSPDVEVGKVIVPSTATIELNPDTSLTITGDSIIHGVLNIICADFIIGADVTISGDGGLIQGDFTTECGYGYLKSASHTLTIQPHTGDNSDPSTSLVVHQKLVIDVALVNDAYVIAGGPETLFLEKGESGEGYWIAKKVGSAAGTLEVNDTVTGNGTWQATEGGTIRIDAACTSLTGDVELNGGTLEINQNFTTTGGLDLSALGKVVVAESKVAVFD